jgi:hypothetical protein
VLLAESGGRDRGDRFDLGAEISAVAERGMMDVATASKAALIAVSRRAVP